MTSEPLDSILTTLTEDDLMYDHPVSMSGEPDDPVLYVRWEAARERIAPLLQDIYDHFMPMHSGPCANQDAYDENAPCICETGPIVERLCAALEAHDDQ